jgi:hypothetical protein
MTTRFRRVLHRTCLLGGRHPEGSQWARECPVLRRKARQGRPRATTAAAEASNLISPRVMGRPPSRGGQKAWETRR